MENLVEMNGKTLEEILQEEENRESEREQLMLSKKYAILDRVQEKASRFGIKLSKDALEQLGKVVTSVRGGIAVTTRKVENPTVIDCGSAKLEYALEQADMAKTDKPFLLSLWFVKPQDEQKKSAQRIRIEKWLHSKGVPFAVEIAQKIDTEKDVNVHVYKYVEDFAREAQRHGELSDEDFFGQKVHQGMISTLATVGIVKNNFVEVFIPKWKFKTSFWTFYVH